MPPLYRFNVVLGFVPEAYRGGRVAASTARPQPDTRTPPLLLLLPRPVPVPPPRTSPSTWITALALALAALLATTLAAATAAAQAPDRSTRFDGVSPVRVTSAVGSASSATPRALLVRGEAVSDPCGEEDSCVLRSAVGGLMGAALGGLMGAGLGFLWDAATGEAVPGAGGAYDGVGYGLLIGAGAGMPLGAHLGNGSRGILLADYLVLGPAFGVGVWAAYAGYSLAPLFVIPLASVVFVEQLTRRK